jgi:hypothetical protein
VEVEAGVEVAVHPSASAIEELSLFQFVGRGFDNFKARSTVSEKQYLPEVEEVEVVGAVEVEAIQIVSSRH